MGRDDQFVEKVGQYFAGTMLEARRYLQAEPALDKLADEGESSAEEQER